MTDNKKFQRDSTNKVIGGVCSGLANYFNLDVALVRILFVLAFFFASFGFWFYIILWIVTPIKSQQTTNYGQQTTNYGQQTTNYGQQTTDYGQVQSSKTTAIFAGILVILIGILFLINNFIPISWVWKLWPLILVGIGILMIVNATKKGDDDE